MSVVQEARRRRPVPPLRRLSRSDVWLAIAVAGITFLLAYDQGGYALSSRAITAIAVWWAILLGVGLGLWPRVGLPRGAWITAGFLAAFAAWTLTSIWWAKSAENAFIEFDRVTMYLAIFLIAVLAGTRANLRRWADGIAVGLAAIAAVSLLSRFFPSTFSLQGFPTFLPGVATRLSFPVGYWNGLAILIGFAYPLWLGLAVRATRWWTRILALLPFPSFASVIYLASSRGGVAAALMGSIAFLAFTARRWTAVGVLIVVTAGSVGALSVLLPRHQLVDGPIRSQQAVAQGHEAFVLILGIAVVAAAIFLLGQRFLSGATPPRALGLVLVAVAALGLVVTAFASHPARRFEAFKGLPRTTSQGDGFVRSHLLSGSGSGRWQFWAAAVQEWKSAPVVGQGAGSYQAWWGEHASFSYFVRNAHSLYLEVLGELGIVGFLLLGAAFALGTSFGLSNTLHRVGDERVVTASLVGVVTAFYIGAGIDWIWQLTALGAIGLASLGLLTGAAGYAVRPVGAGATGHAGRRPRFAVGVTVLLFGWLLLWAQAIPWLADVEIKASREAIALNDGASALRHALDARKIQPWASSPYLQLALVQEQRRNLQPARRWIREAIERNSIDWRLWLVAARIETKLGNIQAARRSLSRAEALNPRSPIFPTGVK